ncbi:hypothetical protein [Actinoplanes sp. NPDC026670]|uniref:hypothetical protein n=1 Tax=Actinoplanes sp. NPDC026670 TaxID=3154700 RepID=UPI0033F98333
MRVTTAAAALFLLLVGGCARPDAGSPAPGRSGPPAPGRSGPPAPEVHQRWESCEVAAPASADDWFGAGRDALGLPLLDDRFQAVAAVVCRVEPREKPGVGTEITAEELRADDVTALLTTLRLPDEAATAEACTEELPLVPWLALIDRDGRWIRPGIPVDSCHKPRTEFRQAFGNLTTTLVTSRVLPGS